MSAVVLGVGLSADPVVAQPRFSSNPFTLGVASGDPLPDGVVLWTRLAPDPLLHLGDYIYEYGPGGYVRAEPDPDNPTGWERTS